MSTTVKIICLVGLAFAVSGLWMYAQNVEAQTGLSVGSIAFCNPTKILQGYKKFMTMNADLMNEKNRMKEKFEKMQVEIKIGSEELAASGFTPDSQEYRRMRNELLKKSIENETYAKFSENELRLQDTRIKEVCLRDIQSAVQKVAEEKGLAMVLQQVLYGDESLDITAEVIEQLNTDYQLGG